MLILTCAVIFREPQLLRCSVILLVGILLSLVTANALVHFSTGADFLSNVLYYRKLIVLPFTAIAIQKQWLTMEEIGKAFAIFASVNLFFALQAWFDLVPNGGIFSKIFQFWSSQVDQPGSIIENNTTQAIIFCVACIYHASKLRRLDQLFVMHFCLISCYLIFIFEVSSSKSGYLFFLSFAFFYLFFSLKEKLGKFWSFGLAAFFSSCFFLIVYFFLQSGSHIDRVLTEITFFNQELAGGNSQGMRISMWLNTYQMITENPWFGVGHNGFTSSYREIASIYSGLRSVITDDPHQQYLFLAAVYGVPMFLFWIAVFGYVALKGMQTNITLACALIAFFCVGFANGVFFSFVEGRVFWLLIGVILGLADLKDPKCERRH